MSSPSFVRIVGLSALAVSCVFGSATRIGFKDAFATARGNAFTATADSPAAIYYNPAGLTQLEGQAISATVYNLEIQSRYTAPGGAETDMVRDPVAIPQIYYAWAPAEKDYALGLGIYAPFGLATDWPDAAGFRTTGTSAEQKTLDLAAMLAYEISPSISVGAGPVYHHAETTLSRGIGMMPGDEFTFNGEGDALGFSAGVHWQPSERHAFGVSYQHHYTIDHQGTADSVPYITGEPSSAEFIFPEVIMVGYSFRPNASWNFEVNLDWTNWDRLNTVTIQKPSGPVAVPFEWQSGFFYDFGVTRYLDANWNISAGYTYAENSAPDATYLPSVPDVDRHFFSFGLGYHTALIGLQLTYQYGISPDRIVVGSPVSLVGESADGTYRNRMHAFAASLDLHF